MVKKSKVFMIKELAYWKQKQSWTDNRNIVWLVSTKAGWVNTEVSEEWLSKWGDARFKIESDKKE